MCSIPTQPQIPAFAMNMNFVTSAVKDTPLERSSQANMRISKMWCFCILLLHFEYVQVLILQGYVYLIIVFRSLELKKSQPQTQTGCVRIPLMTEMVSELSTEPHTQRDQVPHTWLLFPSL